MDTLEQQLLNNAYLFDDPQSYQAGVRDTFALLERHEGLPLGVADRGERREQDQA